MGYNFIDEEIPIVIEHTKTGWSIICQDERKNDKYAFTKRLALDRSAFFLSEADVHKDDLYLYLEAKDNIVNKKKNIHMEFRILTLDGGYDWCKLVSNCICSENGSEVRTICTVQNVDRLVKMNEEMSYINEFDLLTGYNNYASYKLSAAEQIKNVDNIDRSYSISYCDIKNFKIINDLYGYKTGDGLLQHWADIISRSLEPGESFARISADKFSITKMYSKKSELKSYFKRMVKELNGFPALKMHKFVIELVCGVYCIENSSDILSVEDMIDRANIAQKSVKYIGGNQFAEYSRQMREQIVREKEIEADMERALRDGEFNVYLQGQVNIQKNFAVTGAEALVRWIRPEGILAPDMFIPLFEKNGFIVSIDRYVFEQVCKYIRERIDRNKRLFKISVNVSRISLFQPEFVQTYAKIKNKYKIPDEILELECTESIAIKNLQEIDRVSVEMRNNGFSFSMDDFGAGESSLNALKNLNIDVLKLDMGFFKNGLVSKKDRVIVGSIISMAKSLGMQIVAEGIEHLDEVRFLQQIGCDLVQGYVFTRPTPIENFIDEIENKPDMKPDLVPAWTQMSGFSHVQELQQETSVLLDNIMSGLVKCIYDSSCTIVYANNAFYNIIGYTKEQMYKEHKNHFIELVVGDIKKLAVDFAEALQENKEVMEFEFQIRRRDGEIIWIYEQIKYNNDGTFYISVMDISDRKQMEIAIENSNSELHTILDNIPGGIGIYEVGDKIKIVYLNEGIYRLNGVTEEEHDKYSIDSIVMDIIYDEDKKGLINCLHEAIKTNKTIEYTYRFYKLNGQLSWASIRAKRYGEVNGRPRVFAVLLDVTEQKEIEQELYVQKERYQMLEALIKDNLFEYDVYRDYLVYSIVDEKRRISHREYTDYFKNLYEKSLDRPHPDFQHTILEHFARAKEEVCSGSFEYLVKMNKDEYEWHLVDYTSIMGNNNRVIKIVGRIKNINNEVLERERMRRMIDTDPLTGLLNKSAIKRNIQKYLDEDLSESEGYALLMLDLDDFKVINDKLGHSAGDETLVKISRGIENVIDENDIAGRYGGDEYIIFCKNITQKEAELKAERLLESLNQIKVGIENISVKCSIGIVCSDKKGNDFMTMFELADSAMYKVKEKGKNGWHIYCY